MLRIASVLLLVVSSAVVAADPPITPENEAFFEAKVRPILVARCFECHGPDKQKGDVRLDSAAALQKGADGSPLFVAGKPEQSRLIEVIGYEDAVQMPPREKLPAEEIAVLTDWVKRGAPFPVARSAGSLAPGSQEGIAWARAHHWSYQPVKAIEPPDVATPGWSASRIDRFVAAKLAAHGLAPSPQADRATLLRRITFDLTGLPPTFEEVQAFVNDTRPDAWSQVVERLLASPRYGERWGRHWLDVARYSDTKGYVFTEERKYPFSYTYRDYVIRAFNDDKPFNQFVMEQLAADQLPLDEDKTRLAAMGFLTLGRRFGNNVNDIIDDRIDVVSRGLQGLAVGCARCHDHKYDPIPTDDYYSLYAIFQGSMEPGDLPQIGEPAESAGYAEYEKELQKREKAVQEYVDQQMALMREEFRTKAGDYLLAAAQNDDFRNRLRGAFGQGETRRGMVDRWRNYLKEVSLKPSPVFDVWTRLSKLPTDKFAEQAVTVLAETKPPAASGAGSSTVPALKCNPRLLASLERSPPKSLADVARVYGQVLLEVHQEWQKLKQEKPDAAALPGADAEELRQVLYADNSPINFRKEDAGRLYDRAVRNKVSELQRAVDSFKANSPAAPPRAMVLNDSPNPPRTVRVFIRGNPGRPGNEVPRRFLQVLTGPDAKFEKGSGRLELAQAITSADNPLTARVIVNRVWMHHFGYGLVRTPSDFGVRGEKPTHPELLDDLARGFMDNGWSIKWLHRQILASQTWQQASGWRPEGAAKDPENRLLWRMNPRRLEFEAIRDSLLAVTGGLDLTVGGRSIDLFAQPTTRRRTVYGFIDRQDLPGLFRSFDFASPDVSTPQRPQTTVPQQALFAMNSPFVIDQAQTLAQAMAASGRSPEERIREIYQRVLARNPDAEELAAGLAFLMAAAIPEKDSGDWQYGYGRVDDGADGVAGFTPLPHFANTTWKGSAELPDAKLGWVSLTPHGGHPGTPEFAAIRRWTAPTAMTLRLQAELGHSSAQGDGVRARVISSRQGLLGTWTAHNQKVATVLDQVTVEADEALDFVVDCRTEPSFDSFSWSPVLQSPSRTWNATREFKGPKSSSTQSPTAQYVQALLLSNEFVFVD